MDRFDAMTLFVRIVETGSFTKAANGLDMPRATATLTIQKLEQRLGVRLLERTTRQVRPTFEGKAFHERCVHLLAELEDAEALLKPVTRQPSGILRVEMHGTQARKIVLPHIQDFHRRYPELSLVLTSGDRRVDLIGEGVDCALRSGAPEDSSLVARKLADMPQVICASPAYLEHLGVPAHPDELHAHGVVRFFSGSQATDSTLDLLVDGQPRSFEAGGWITVNDGANYVECARQGCGLIQLPRFSVAPLLASGELVEVLAEWPKPVLPLYAVYPERRQLSPRVRVFLDWIVSLYGGRFEGPAPAT
ncbi:LysR substrate-binding domain-containing protein [Halomonas sp. THAF12]|uniref:LysR substrate-binding domain-containing protein n=1 Tax=Halomonas sp. B23F22_10 TaxID=3459515 RepID=UPI00373F84C0